MTTGSGASRSIGLDLGGTKCLGVVIDEHGEIVDEERRPTPHAADEVIDVLTAVATTLLDRSSAQAAAQSGRVSPSGGGIALPIGVGVPGLVDAGGVLRFAPNLPGVIDLAVRDRLLASLGLGSRGASGAGEEAAIEAGSCVVVENDASCAAWGERSAGAAVGLDHVVLVTLGTGIGGGLVLGGSLYRGANGFAGEIGHIVVDPAGPLCPCGQRGCWERFASGSGLGRLAREVAEAGRAPTIVELAGGDPDDVRGEHVTRAAADGDDGALAVMATFARWVGLGLANLANAFDPQAFVLGGGLVEAGDVLLEPVRTAFADLLDGADQRPTIDVLPATLGEHAGAIGAALLARSAAAGAGSSGRSQPAEPPSRPPNGGETAR